MKILIFLSALLAVSMMGRAQNVGVGTASPSSKLTISGNASIGAAYAGVAAPANGLIVQSNVGVGTSAPAALLHVSKTTVFNEGHIRITQIGNGDARIQFDNTPNPTKWWHIGASSDPADANSTMKATYWNGSFATDILTVKGNGRVGINAPTPLGALDVAANSGGIWPTVRLMEYGDDYARLQFDNTINPTKWWRWSGYAAASDADSRMHLNYFNGSSGADVVSVDGLGRVGIGTTTPASRLQVRGNPSSEIITIEAPLTGSQYMSLGFRDVSSTGFYAGLYAIAENFPVTSTAFSIATTAQSTIKEKMRITGIGRVGIGTPNPYSMLHILDDDPSGGSFNPAIWIQSVSYSTGTSATDGLLMGYGVDPDGSGGAAVFWNHDAHPILLGVNNTEIVRVQQDFKVGIGAQTPTASLHIAQITGLDYPRIRMTNNACTATGGNIFFDGFRDLHIQNTEGRAITLSNAGAAAYLNSLGDFHIQDLNGSSGDFFVNAAAGPGYFHVESNGNIAAILGVNYQWPSADAAGQLTSDGFGNLSWTNYSETDPEVNVSAGNIIPRCDAAGSELVDGSIYDDGNIGIGTTSPAALLHVSTNSGSTPQLRLTETDNDYARFQFDNTSNPTKYWHLAGYSGATDDASRMNMYYYNGSSGSDLLSVTGAGRVGIGTASPVNVFHANSNSSATCYGTFTNTGTGTAATDGLAVGNTGLSAYVWNYEAGSTYFGTSNMARVIIDASGNVGIGTLAPGSLLEVNGTASKPGGGSWAASSDARLKKDVSVYTDGLAEVMSINPVRFNYNELSGHDTSVEYVGVIAQELREVAPYMVGQFEKKGEEYLNVDNSAMIYMLINAVKEQQRMIEDQQAEIDELKTRLTALMPR